MLAASDGVAVTPEATSYCGIVAALLQVQDKETPILHRQALLDGRDAAERFPFAAVFLPSCRNAKSSGPSRLSSFR